MNIHQIAIINLKAEELHKQLVRLKEEYRYCDDPEVRVALLVAEQKAYSVVSELGHLIACKDALRPVKKGIAA